MSVGNSNQNLYYSIYDGKICRQFKVPDSETKERINKNGKTVFEKFYDYIDGIITDIEVKDGEYGKQWIITLEDEGLSQVLQLHYSSGYANGFLKALPNVELDQKVKIIPSLKVDGDKKKTTLFISQHGVAIKWFYTKDSPNDIPKLVKKKVKGKEVYDDSDILEFLENMVKEDIVPQLKKRTPSVIKTDLDEVFQDDKEEAAPF